MVDLIKWLHQLLIDKGTRWITKLFLIGGILFILFLVDNYFGWSYYSQTNNQISILKDINDCLKDSTNTSEETTFLNLKRAEVISRKTLIINSLDYVKSLFTPANTGRSFWENFKFNLIHNTSITRSYRFFLLNFGIIIVFLISLFRKLKKDREKSKRTSDIIYFLFFVSFMCVIINLIYGLIPIISKSHIWINYLIYLFIGIVNTIATWEIERKEGLLDK
jgi:TM2 domain-containing membrane protein YozV